MGSSRVVCLLFGILFTSADVFLGWAFQPTPATRRSTTSRIILASSSTPSSGSQRTQVSSASSISNNNSRGGGSLTLLGSNNNNRNTSSGKLHKDVVIVGGGLAGLSVALHLSQLDPTRHITILERTEMLSSPTGSFAAAGMLAPQSERLPQGDYLDLCMASKRLFPDFCQQVERLAREAGDEGAPYLTQDSNDNNGLEPWNIGYVAAGGFLAPAFAGDSIATWAPPPPAGGESNKGGSAIWLDATQVRELEPNLSSRVVGGWWFPEDSSVDARRLACSLKAACVGAGVQFLCGKNYEVSSLDLAEGKCNGLWLKTGKYIATNDLLVANGAWMRTLLPVPIEPHKGQSVSLRMPKDQPPILRRVLFGQDSYIVPKADGRIVIGATVEAGSYDGKVTPAGIMHILSYALELLPALADLPLEETWAGLRPTTPDKGPILGSTPWDNLYLAGGYWRNGVLLAPKTGELMASLIAGVPMSEDDQSILKAFAWDRFTSPEGGAAVAANARYAASMYPIHQRKSGVGVAAAVGTELGSYSTAVSAREERQKDRDEDDDEALEKAAMMGKQDAAAFSFGDGSSKWKSSSQSQPEPPALLVDDSAIEEPKLLVDIENLDDAALPHFLELNPELASDDSSNGKADQQGADSPNADLSSIYKNIQDNKSKQTVELEKGDSEDERSDPGFRIYHIDQETGEQREVPPFTLPGEFLESIKSKESVRGGVESQSTKQGIELDNETLHVNGASPTSTRNPDEYTEKTYDGYQAILDASGSLSREEQLAAMREARRKNRIDENGEDVF